MCDGVGQLVVRDLGTGEDVVLASVPGAQLMFPRWSPDGQRLAFLRRPLATGEGPDLRLLTLGTGEETVVEAQPWPDSPPAFSSDGARLAFTSRAEERLRVVVYTFATGA